MKRKHIKTKPTLAKILAHNDYIRESISDISEEMDEVLIGMFGGPLSFMHEPPSFKTRETLNEVLLETNLISWNRK